MVIRSSKSEVTKLQKVTAAENNGTMFYRCTLDQVINAHRDANSNVWLIYALEEYGWNAIDFDHNLFGSALIDDDLYICKTDGYEININGENVDPETALEYYDIEELSGYIENADDDIILHSITTYELSNKLDINELAIQMLNDQYSFLDLVEAAKDADFIE